MPTSSPTQKISAMDHTIFSSGGVAYTEDQILHIVSEIKDYQTTHGSLLKTVQYETESSVSARPVGTSILPTAFPRKAFNEAVHLQQAFNELYIRLASDPDWLYGVLGPLIEHDLFIAALWDIYNQVRAEGVVQDVVCGVFRSDYMLHDRAPNDSAATVELKQVEMNTFSAAGFCHAERIANMHRTLAQQVRELSLEDVAYKFPDNRNTAAIVGMLEAAHHNYVQAVSWRSDRRKCVLMPVQPRNYNIADERPIQYGLWERGIPCYRCEWSSISTHASLLEYRTLLFDPPMSNELLEVSVIYYRAGYEPEEYDEQGKAIRLRLEMSRAIKCPDVLTHLTNMKAVQQALVMPGALERFISPEKGKRIRNTFVPMQVLDSSQLGLGAREIAQTPEKAENYVLKPNRDGGGHNIYRSDIPPFLAQKPTEMWRNYVLMRLIEPPKTTGALMTLKELYIDDIISELGVLGVCLWRRSVDDDGYAKLEIMRNEAAGWTFKSKPSDVDEMSVVKGYGCFDCPLLVD